MSLHLGENTSTYHPSPLPLYSENGQLCFGMAWFKNVTSGDVWQYWEEQQVNCCRTKSFKTGGSLWSIQLDNRNFFLYSSQKGVKNTLLTVLLRSTNRLEPSNGPSSLELTTRCTPYNKSRLLRYCCIPFTLCPAIQVSGSIKSVCVKD